MEQPLTQDTQAVLLLCGELGQHGGNGPKPLGLRQYNSLVSWMRDQGLRPGDLLGAEARTKLAGLQRPRGQLRAGHTAAGSWRCSSSGCGEVGKKRPLGHQSKRFMLSGTS